MQAESVTWIARAARPVPAAGTSYASTVRGFGAHTEETYGTARSSAAAHGDEGRSSWEEADVRRRSRSRSRSLGTRRSLAEAEAEVEEILRRRRGGAAFEEEEEEEEEVRVETRAALHQFRLSLVDLPAETFARFVDVAVAARAARAEDE